MEKEIYKIIDKEKLNIVNDSIENAHGLPNECYLNGPYSKIERKKIFEDKWVTIGVASSVPNPGDTKPIDLLGIPLLIIRDKKHQVRVFHNVCSHRGYKLIQKNPDLMIKTSEDTIKLLSPYLNKNWKFKFLTPPNGNLELAPTVDRFKLINPESISLKHS